LDGFGAGVALGAGAGFASGVALGSGVERLSVRFSVGAGVAGADRSVLGLTRVGFGVGVDFATGFGV